MMYGLPNSRPWGKRRRGGEHGAATRTWHGGSTCTRKAAAYYASGADQSPIFPHQIEERSAAEVDGAELNASLSSTAMAPAELLQVAAAGKRPTKPIEGSKNEAVNRYLHVIIGQFYFSP